MALLEETLTGPQADLEPRADAMPGWFPVEGYDDVAQKLVKEAVCGAIGFVPYVGGILGKCVGLALDYLWPSGQEDITWTSIVAKIKAIVREEIQKYYNDKCKNELQDMKSAVAAYRVEADLVAAGKGNKAWALSRMNVAIDRIQNHMGTFSNSDYKYATLSFYAQAANLNLLLLKDKVKNAKKNLGASDPEIDAAKRDLTRLGGKGGVYPKYVADTFGGGWCRDNYPTYVQCHDYTRVMYLVAYELIPLWERLATDDTTTKIDRRVELHVGPVGWYKWRGYWDWQKMIFPPPFRPTNAVSLTGLNMWEGSLNGIKYGVNGTQSIHNGHAGNVYGKQSGSCAEVRLADGEYFAKVGFDWHPGPRSQGFAQCNALQGVRVLTSKNIHHFMGGSWDSPQCVNYFGIPDFKLYDILAFSNHGSSGFLEAVVFAFRPVEEAWTPKNTSAALVSGAAYNLVEASTGHLLDVDRYTLVDTTAPVARETSGTRSRDWILHDAGNGAWRLVNHYSNQVLTCADGAARLSQTPETLEASAWTITLHDDGACTVAASADAERRLSLGPDGTVGVATSSDASDEPSRWVLTPASAPPDDTLEDLLPTLHVAEPVQQDPTRADFTLSVPPTGRIGPDWTLEFYLPVEAAQGLSLEGDGVRLASQTDQRGTLVAITPEPSGDPEPTQNVSFTLSCARSRILPTDTSLNDTAVLVRGTTTAPPGVIEEHQAVSA